MFPISCKIQIFVLYALKHTRKIFTPKALEVNFVFCTNSKSKNWTFPSTGNGCFKNGQRLDIFLFPKSILRLRELVTGNSFLFIKYFLDGLLIFDIFTIFMFCDVYFLTFWGHIEDILDLLVIFDDSLRFMLRFCHRKLTKSNVLWSWKLVSLLV